MRKLATAALAFSAAVFLANFILPAGRLVGLAALSALLGIALTLLRRRWLRPAALALVFFAAGLLEYAAFCHLTLDRARGFAGETREVTGVVLEYPDEYAGYCRLRVRIDTPDLPHFKAIVYDNKKVFAEAEPGQHIRFTAKISAADTLFGKPYDNYLINGYYWKMSIKGDEALGAFSLTPQSIPVRLHRLLCARVDEVFPVESRAFLKALMLGDKQEFYEDDALYVTLSRAGLMHVAAVSGLHISFLVGLLLLLFGNGRRGALCSVVLIWCFVLVSGSSKSALRAGFMQTLLLLAPILRRENDPVTSLSAVLALILAACPFAAGSVSLQLSFAAMAGILCFAERLRAWLLKPLPRKLRHGVWAYIPDVLASSLSVTAFTVPLTALHFSYVPLLAVFSNLLCLWAVSFCFCLAWAACLLSYIPLLGSVTVWVCTLLVRYILFCARLIASNPYAVLYTQTKGALLWMGATYMLLLLAFLVKGRLALRILLPGCVSLALLAVVITCSERRCRERDWFSVLDVGQGQCIAVMAGEDTALIDCGNTSNLDDAGSIAGEYLLSRGRRRIGLLILTHLHEDHADGVSRLMEMVPVERVILPSQPEEHTELFDGILAAAERHGTELVQIEQDTEENCGRIALRLYAVPPAGKNDVPSLMVRASVGETDLLVTGDATQKQESAVLERADFTGTELLIAGHHGAKNAASAALLEEAGGTLAIVSAGYNTYGHPTPETLARLAEYGYTIRRTDEEGTIEIPLESCHG